MIFWSLLSVEKWIISIGYATACTAPIVSGQCRFCCYFPIFICEINVNRNILFINTWNSPGHFPFNIYIPFFLWNINHNGCRCWCLLFFYAMGCSVFGPIRFSLMKCKFINIDESISFAFVKIHDKCMHALFFSLSSQHSNQIKKYMKMRVIELNLYGIKC